MAKTRSRTEDKEALQKKVHERQAKSDNPEGDEAIRSLRKRLKRAQRKLRGVKLREQQAASKKSTATA